MSYGNYGQPPAYGQQPYYGQQPAFNQQQPYAQQPYHQPQTIIVNHSSTQQPTIVNMTQFGKISRCQMCQRDTDNVMRHKVGCVTFAWCCCLLSTVVLFWVPFVIDSCKDTEVVCQSCGLIKTTIPANCC